MRYSKKSVDKRLSLGVQLAHVTQPLKEMKMSKKTKKQSKRIVKQPAQWSQIVPLSKVYQKPYTGVIRHVGTAY